MPLSNATCMFCGATWEADFERDAVWDGHGAPEDGDRLLFAVCAGCYPDVDTDELVARLDELQPNARDTIEFWGSDDGKHVKIAEDGAA